MGFIELSGILKFGLLKLKDHHSWAIIALVTLGISSSRILGIAPTTTTTTTAIAHVP